MTQGDPVSPTIFNIMVNALVRSTLLEVCVPQEAYHGMGWEAGDQDIVFYADGGRITVIKPIWVQGILTTLV